jgi:hypothetical protein
MSGMQGQQGQDNHDNAAVAMLSYRPAAAVDVTVASLLKRRDRLFHLKILGMLTLGLPLLFVAPGLLASFLDVCLTHAAVGNDHTWRLLLIACSVVVIPLLFWIELGTDGRFFEMQATFLGPADDYPFAHLSSYGDYQMRQQEGAIIGFTEIMLFAPRLVLGALRPLRIRRVIGPVDVSLASHVLTTLLSNEQGLETVELLPPGRTPEQLQCALAYLAFHEWIGVAKDGRRTWALTETRQLLRKRSVQGRAAVI